jgi:hypothetical protein
VHASCAHAPHCPRVVLNAETEGANTILNVSVEGAPRNGVEHLTPVACVASASMGPFGNMDRPKYGTNEPITNPTEYEFILALSNDPLVRVVAAEQTRSKLLSLTRIGQPGSSERNKHFQTYLDWLSGLRGLIADYVVANQDKFPAIKVQSCSRERSSPSILRDCFMQRKLRDQPEALRREMALLSILDPITRSPTDDNVRRIYFRYVAHVDHTLCIH